MTRYRLPLTVIPLVAFIPILPLILHGCSCGHDFDFHILNWLEAAHQFQHGNLHPHWAYTPAFNAGEPRFVFYPPISWALGALLGIILPWIATPIAYTWLSLTAAGLSLYYLAKSFATPQAALLAATFYIVNPYMLFTAYERTAYGELLAAAWIPLLLHAILAEQITIPRIAIPLALLWLTNAPAAVMSCYTLALLALIRIALYPGSPFMRGHRTKTSATPTRLSIAAPLTTIQLAVRTTAGTALGLALAAFYIFPAAYERRFVQITMAILPELSPGENFLFHHTSDAEHDAVLRKASIVAVVLIVLTAITLVINLLNRRRTDQPSAAKILPLTILTFTITLLLTPLSAPLWHYLPELRFLQFPWRLLAVLAPTLSLIIALSFGTLKLKPIPATVILLALAACFTYPAYRAFHQRCYTEDTVPSIVSAFQSHQGSDPTDEYTPITADNDALANTNPPFWLTSNPDAPAPQSPNPGPAPSHLTLNSATSQILILNLRNYPAWQISNNGVPISTRLTREDGLIAFPIPAGPANIAITYPQTVDQIIGYIITAIAILALILLHRRKTLTP